MKTLYEILEVSETASKEIIEKAYKVLAKKYHPDLQKQENKEKAEQKMKQINDAYEILSDDLKRKKYDEELKSKRQQEEIKKNENIHNQNYNQQQNITEQELKNMEQKMQQMKDEYEEKYRQAYENRLRSLGYKIKYKWTKKRVIDLLKVILIITAIVLFLWFFPPTHKMLVDFYESNTIIKAIIDVIGAIFVGFWNSICSFF